MLSHSKSIDVMNLDIDSFARHARARRNTVSLAPAASSGQTHIGQKVRVIKAALGTFGQDLQRRFYDV